MGIRLTGIDLGKRDVLVASLHNGIPVQRIVFVAAGTVERHPIRAEGIRVHIVRTLCRQQIF